IPDRLLLGAIVPYRRSPLLSDPRLLSTRRLAAKVAGGRRAAATSGKELLHPGGVCLEWDDRCDYMRLEYNLQVASSPPLLEPGILHPRFEVLPSRRKLKLGLYTPVVATTGYYLTAFQAETIYIPRLWR